MKRFKFYNFNAISSTNLKAKEFAKQGKFDSVIIAAKQTKGRGRFKRNWSSGLGGLYMTLVLKENIENAKYLTLVAAVSVAKTIKKISGLNAMVKWPNDVMVSDKKVCGILTEAFFGRENFALVGIGLNVNQKIFRGKMRHNPTSLFLEKGKGFNIKKISNSIIKNFNRLHHHYEKNNYKKIIDEWKGLSHTLGNNVVIKTMKKSYFGRAVNIDKDCNLIVRLKNGRLRKITEGDVFVV